METEQEELDRRVEESKRIALDIEDGMKSRYWKHIEIKIKGWFEAETKHLELLNMRLIRLPEDVEERNDVVKRIGLLKQFLKINETIRAEQLGIIDVMRLDVPKEFERKPSFVGQRPTEITNAGGNYARPK